MCNLGWCSQQIAVAMQLHISFIVLHKWCNSSFVCQLHVACPLNISHCLHVYYLHFYFVCTCVAVARMRGVPSEAMVMCASTPEKVEILEPPPDCVPGDRVTCEGYTGELSSVLVRKHLYQQVGAKPAVVNFPFHVHACRE